MLDQLKHQAEHFVQENAAALLTGVGVVGTVGTAVLTGRASFKAAELIEGEYKSRSMDGIDTEAPPLPTGEKVKLTWPLFLVPVATGGITVAAVVGANRISSRQAAALAVAYSVSERNFQEYKEKALEKLGVNKEQKLRDEVAQDRVTKNENHQVIMVGEGDVLCYDPLTGRYFKSSVEKLSRAMATVHSEIWKYHCCSFNHFLEEIGLESTDLANQVGWNDKDIPEIHWTATTTTDDRPCLSIEFSPPPHPMYADLY